jgi:hypothetical protein
MIKHSEMKVITFEVFWEYSKKAFNTNTEDTKDKKIKFQNKFNPKNVCCAKCALLFITTVPSKNADKNKRYD